MYDNLKYFIETFHIDGVRFDATSYMDHNALKEVVAKLKSEYTDIIFIAEQLPNSDSLRGTGIAQWSDPFHDSIKALLRMGKFEGSNYNSDSLGKITYYTKDNGWSASPKETINYMESHDENSVRHEVLTNTGKTTEDALKATKLGALHLFTSLGTPMLMAGQEFFKDRVGQDTSEANGQIDWTWYTKNENEKNVFNYYKNLIALRIAHPELRMTDPDPAGKGDFRWSITPGNWGNLGYPYTNGGDLLIGYALNVAGTKGDYRWVVALNYSTSAKKLDIVFPTSGSWTILANGTEVNPDGLDSLTAEGTTESGFKASHTIPARSGLFSTKGELKKSKVSQFYFNMYFAKPFYIFMGRYVSHLHPQAKAEYFVDFYRSSLPLFYVSQEIKRQVSLPQVRRQHIYLPKYLFNSFC